ncbi:MAG: hypothetical protein ACK4RS_04420, partial [Thiothrix sp.]
GTTSPGFVSGEQLDKTTTATLPAVTTATPATVPATAIAATATTLESKNAHSSTSNTATASTAVSSNDGSKAAPVANVAAPATFVSSGVAPVSVAPAGTVASERGLETELVTIIPALESTKPMLLPTAGTNPISSTAVTSVVTAPDAVAPLVAPSGGLAEPSKADATLTTASGEVVAAVTPASAPATASTATSVPGPAVRWGKYDPAAPVDATTTAADQVNSAYTRLADSALGGYVLERQNEARALPAEQADVSFNLGSYEAAVSNSRSGVSVGASIDNAHLRVSASRGTYTTGFHLTSALYSGEITASGTFVGANGTFHDAGTGATRLNGVVAMQGDTANAAYVFTHEIDPELSARGALNWSASLATPAVTPASTLSTTAPTTVIGIAD